MKLRHIFGIGREEQVLTEFQKYGRLFDVYLETLFPLWNGSRNWRGPPTTTGNQERTSSVEVIRKQVQPVSLHTR